MDNFDEFKIKFVGLKDGKHDFNYKIGKSFFELFDYQEFNEVDVEVGVLLNKKATMLDLTFIAEGFVNVNCDVSNEAYDQPIKNKLELVVKFGDRYNDNDDELLIIPRNEIKLAIQQYVYETILLGVPYKKVHPGVKDGSLQSKVLDKLEELSPGHHKDHAETDPRWDKLKKLLNEK